LSTQAPLLAADCPAHSSVRIASVSVSVRMPDWTRPVSAQEKATVTVVLFQPLALAVGLGVPAIRGFVLSRLMPPAVAVSLFGEAIQLWSFASLVKNEQLTARGPYVLVRNPMYLGRYFLILGLLLLFANPWVLLGYSVLYYFYMVNRVGREEQRLAGLLGEPYARYRTDVNRFLPDPRRLTDPAMRFFSLPVMVNNNGHWNLLSVLIGYGALYLYIFFLS